MATTTKTSRTARANDEPRRAASEFRRRTWVTRPRPGIDRMSSAWLIRKFIDRQARFTFAAKPPSDARVVPFDMYGVEFGHHGKHCTFETLVARFGVNDDVVNWLAEIVHDVDLKERHYDHPEAAGVEHMVAGLRARHEDDAALLEHGIEMFESLAASRSSAPPTRGRRRSRRDRRQD